MVIGNKKDIIELDELSDDCLKANFGYTDAGIENLRDQAKEIEKRDIRISELERAISLRDQLITIEEGER